MGSRVRNSGRLAPLEIVRAGASRRRTCDAIRFQTGTGISIASQGAERMTAAGRTLRTEVLYGLPGLAYVYFVYGMHWCVNAVTRRKGLPGAVLIRAVEPVEGEAAMRRRRSSVRRVTDLTSGPGRLCAALGITGPAHHGRSLQRGALRLLAGRPVPDVAVAVTPRIGVAKAADWPLRYLIRESPFVSARAQTARWISKGTR